jgi:hypothetical protein
MARFRVESVLDSITGKYFNELYSPETATTPMATSAPLYQSFQAAEDGAVDLMQRAMPGQPVRVVDPPKP